MHWWLQLGNDIIFVYLQAGLCMDWNVCVWVCGCVVTNVFGMFSVSNVFGVLDWIIVPNNDDNDGDNNQIKKKQKRKKNRENLYEYKHMNVVYITATLRICCGFLNRVRMQWDSYLLFAPPHIWVKRVNDTVMRYYTIAIIAIFMQTHI